MQLQNIFKQDINRNINPVVKTNLEDEAILQQELSEYVITRELDRHFNTFFEHYRASIDAPTDKIGVWISGFFGSGKSHFLKMLSCLLSNREVCGKKAVEYFNDKFDSAFLKANVDRSCSVPTESILFNIGTVAPGQKDETSVLRTFAKMFYDHLGYYGSEQKIVQLEKHLAHQGKTEEFHSVFESLNGSPWTECRVSYSFWEDDIVRALQSVLGMTEQAARNWFNAADQETLSVSSLVDDIRKYVNSRGKQFRLLFMVDEVGQFIGGNTGLMLNLQSLVEEIGARCGGKVWVMVTSQEAIDSVVKVVGDDFSKIQGRFDTRLSLSSSSVDEVIKKRILDKTPVASQTLSLIYEQNQNVLKNLYVFSDSIKDLNGFRNEDDFVASYPFIPYQFTILQKVLVEIRNHGNSGKHISGGERSMLNSFQEVAKKLQSQETDTLVPFHLFYDTIQTILDSPIRRVIERCLLAAENHNGLEAFDADVLKLLYLIRYVDDNIKSSVDNIAILMIDNLQADKIELRRIIQDSLDRLLSQNYISRNGDAYYFLTDEEQDIAKEIKNTTVDHSGIISSIARTVFDNIYAAKKFRYEQYYDFSFNSYVDDSRHGLGSDGDICLKVYTEAHDFCNASDQELRMKTQGGSKDAFIVLPKHSRYYEDLEQAAKIRKYAKMKNIALMPESAQDIIRKRQQEADRLEKAAADSLGSALLEARVFVNGDILSPRKSSGAKERLESVLEALVQSVYSKLNLVNSFSESDEDLAAILRGQSESVLPGTGANNEEALYEVSTWLEQRADSNLTTSMEEVQKRYSQAPFGWREIDIAALIARLLADRKIIIRYAGAIMGMDHPNLVNVLRKKSEVSKALVERKMMADEQLLREARLILRDLMKQQDIPSEEDALCDTLVNFLSSGQETDSALLREYDRAPYPGRDVLQRAIDCRRDVLEKANDHNALLSLLKQKQDDLLDAEEDRQPVISFFRGQQRTIVDRARALLSRLQAESSSLSECPEIRDALLRVQEILALPLPYPRISELPDLMDQAERKYAELLDLKRADLNEHIRLCMATVHRTADENRSSSRSHLSAADSFFDAKKAEVARASSLTMLDAMIFHLEKRMDEALQAILTAAAQEKVAHQVPASSGSSSVPPRPKITTIRRHELCAASNLSSQEEVDAYVESIRSKLMASLNDNDLIQIN